MRSSAPSKAAGSAALTNSSVLAMRAFSPSNVLAVSSKIGISTPVSRAVEFLAWSQADCTCSQKGNMSG